jgi:hypothetical protein
MSPAEAAQAADEGCQAAATRQGSEEEEEALLSTAAEEIGNSDTGDGLLSVRLFVS